MADYIFSVDGTETGTVGPNQTAFVYNLDFFDKTDIVTAPFDTGTLAFEIDGGIDLDLTGYAGITGFDTVTVRSVAGGVNLTIGQDFNTPPPSYSHVSVVAQSDVDGTIVLDASALSGYRSAFLDAQSDGHNVLTGGAFNDYLSGGAGADRFDGGGGIDRVDLSHSQAGVTVDLVAGTGIGGAAQGDTYINIESIVGTAFADRLIGVGGSVEAEIDGGPGNDVVIASSGYAYGGAGDDVLIVTGAMSRCWGGPGIDQVNFKIAPHGVRLDLIDRGPTAFGPTFDGFENVYGSESNDQFYGDGGSNVLEGAGGDDILQGRGGSDVLRGGAGADQLDGGSGNGSDTVSYWLSSIGVTVNLATGTGHGGDAEGDTLTGFETLSGSQGNDFLTGDVFANTLQGWNGDDVLEGGIGKDVLTGGAGADRFVFTTVGDSLYGADADRITDFSHAQGDKIDLSAVFGGPHSEFEFIGQSTYSSPQNFSGPELRFAFTSPTTTTIAGDLDGDAVSDFHIVLSGHINLSASDFIL